MMIAAGVWRVSTASVVSHKGYVPCLMCLTPHSIGRSLNRRYATIIVVILIAAVARY